MKRGIVAMIAAMMAALRCVFQHPKTSVSGVVTLLCVYGPNVWPKYAQQLNTLAVVAAGLGLIVSQDAKPVTPAAITTEPDTKD